MLLHKKRVSMMRLSFVFLAMSCISVTYAANFYTIIGPDGRPIVVQKPSESDKKEKEQLQPQVEHKPIASTQKEQAVSPSEKIIVVKPEKPQQVESVPVVKLNNETVTTAKNAEVKREIKAEQKQTVARQEVEKPVQPKQSDHVVSSNASTSVTVQNQPVTQQQVETAPNNKTVSASKDNANITEIDGVKYVNNEYLEDHEFNLEGKKRFYVMPETGAMAGGRFETVERQKGLSQSLLDKIRQPKHKEHKAIALATTYYRLPKDEVIQTLEQSCFSGKKIDKAKTISLKNQEVSFFPVAPIKENFAYEVVKLDTNIENILFSSYASSKKKPSYYWPLVVFLDEKGCVVEGVSGFKNDEQNESATQYSSLEGILKKPNSAYYLFMTPLSEAIDIQDRELTNQGQIKLSVIQ